MRTIVNPQGGSSRIAAADSRTLFGLADLAAARGDAKAADEMRARAELAVV
jgi:hypothetical protein